MIETSIKYKDSLKTIKWHDLFILHEFQQYLTRNDFIEISILNKVLRQKLKHIIFYSIEINEEFLRSLPNYFRQFSFMRLKMSKRELQANLNFKSEKIDPFISELVKRIDTFANYLKYLKLSGIAQSGYYIIPSITASNNLTSLSLSNIVVNMGDFYSLLPKLEKLECLDLEELRLIRLLDEEIIEHGAPISSTLKELSISGIYINSTDTPNFPYKFVFDGYLSFRENTFYFKLNHHPNLKKFKLYSTIYSIEFVLDFLALNTQLTDIRLPVEYFTTEYINILSNSNNINSIHIDTNDVDANFFTGQNFVQLNSLNSLTITLPNKYRYIRVYDIIYICPNLTKLDIAVTTYTSEFITKILKKLKLLKILKLKVQNISSEVIDLNIFSNVEIVRMDVKEYRTIHYTLPKPPMKFKSITFSLSPLNDDSFNLMRQRYKNDPNWKITLSNSYMKFLSSYN
jgi:hypothetical protein